MKKNYLSLVICSFLSVNSILAMTEDQGIGEVANAKANELESDTCERLKINISGHDEIKDMIVRFEDDRVAQIIKGCSLLHQNCDFYLCEADKLIAKYLALQNKRVNFNNFIRLSKALTFGACSVGCGYMIYNAYKYPQENIDKKKRIMGAMLMAIIGSVFGLQGLSELQKIANNYDQNQLYYKAIAIKNALLGYKNRFII